MIRNDTKWYEMIRSNRKWHVEKLRHSPNLLDLLISYFVWISYEFLRNVPRTFWSIFCYCVTYPVFGWWFVLFRISYELRMNFVEMFCEHVLQSVGSCKWSISAVVAQARYNLSRYPEASFILWGFARVCFRCDIRLALKASNARSLLGCTQCIILLKFVKL